MGEACGTDTFQHLATHLAARRSAKPKLTPVLKLISILAKLRAGYIHNV